VSRRVLFVVIAAFFLTMVFVFALVVSLCGFPGR
jgi:hypothetical protein